MSVRQPPSLPLFQLTSRSSRHPRAAIPKIWLFTDERNDHQLDQAISRLPRGNAVVFRHYHLVRDEREGRFRQLRRLARRRGHIILLAGTPGLARQWRAHGVYGGGRWPDQRQMWQQNSAVHDVREIRRANGRRTAVFFLSPAFPTRSHPGEKALKRSQLRRLAALCRGAVILLGGMDARRFRQMKMPNIHGWAAIDAFSR